MKKVLLCIASLCLGFGGFAQDNEAEAALVAMGSTAYWNNWKTDYETWDSYWDVDDQTMNVQVLKGLSPANGLEVDPSSITNGTSYKIEYIGDVLAAESNKKGMFEKFGIRWQYWGGYCENYQKVNPITGQKWTNDCHKVAKGYSVDFSDPANRLVRFQYQLVSTVDDPSIRVDLCDVKGRKGTISDGSTIVSHIKTIVETNNIYLPNDEDSWYWFEGAFCDEGEADELLVEDFDSYSFTIGDICDQAYWWNGVNFTINGEGYQAPADLKLKLDLKHIIGIDIYVNDEETSGKSTLFIKNLVIGNDITRNQDGGIIFNLNPNIFQHNGITLKKINDYEVKVIKDNNNYSGSIIIPNTVEYNNKNFSVVSIESNAFSGCSELTSITVPESVTSIGESAFSGCNNLDSITINGDVDVSNAGLYFTKDGLRYHVLNKNSVEITNDYYSGDIVIPANVTAGNTFAVTGIEYGAFSYSTDITSITINSNIDVSNAELYFTKDGIKYHVLDNNSVKIAEKSYSGNIVIPTSITAGNIFSVVGIEYGAFSYSTDITSITINCNVDVSNAGLYFTKNGIRYHVLNKNSVEVCNGGYYSYSNYSGDVVIPSSVTAGNTFAVIGIDNYVFSGCTSLTSITIPESVTHIGESAFSGCTKLTKVTCLATTPPEAATNSFENYNGYLYIPCEGKDDYDVDACWGSFKHVECIGAETVELPKDEVKVEPEKTEAVFSMPTNESAYTYTLTIQNNGVTFCTLTFNSQGQLVNIDFSTTKSYELKAGVSAYQFTVTGLSEATDYGYSFKALASNKSVLKEYTGSFTTKNADGTGGSSQGGQGIETSIEGVSNATTVAIVNNQILVNGEAPAFVTNISGQKIANLNLKAGVYFVNVEGEMVKVSVK